MSDFALTQAIPLPRADLRLLPGLMRSDQRLI